MCPCLEFRAVLALSRAVCPPWECFCACSDIVKHRNKIHLSDLPKRNLNAYMARKESESLERSDKEIIPLLSAGQRSPSELHSSTVGGLISF